MPRAVILHHRLPCPDGSHFDWLLERVEGPDPQDRVLIAFRVADASLVLNSGSFEGERIQDHRRLYLAYEGAIEGDRGVVERVAAGRIVRMGDDSQRMAMDIDWGDRVVTYLGRPSRSANSWTFTATCGERR